MTTPKKTQQKPLIEIKSPLRARVYRAKFRAFETTKFIDEKVLKQSKKVTIEIGTLEIAGTTQTISAEIRSGMIVAFKPVLCAGCGPKKTRKIGSAAFKKTIQLVSAALKERGISTTPMPMPIKISSRLGFQIPIGPIIIIIFDPGTILDLCIQVWIGNRSCWYCLFAPTICIGMG